LHFLCKYDIINLSKENYRRKGELLSGGARKVMTLGEKLVQEGYEVRIYGCVKNGVNPVSNHLVVMGLDNEIRIFKTQANVKKLSMSTTISLSSIMHILQDEMAGQPIMLLRDGDYYADDLLIEVEDGVGFLYTVTKKTGA